MAVVIVSNDSAISLGDFCRPITNAGFCLVYFGVRAYTSLCIVSYPAIDLISSCPDVRNVVIPSSLVWWANNGTQHWTSSAE